MNAKTDVGNERAPDFDAVCARFTQRVAKAANWKHAYFGAAYSTRINAAIFDLKVAIAEAERHPELAPPPAVNSHDALVKALEQMLATIDFYRQINPTITINQSEIGEARAALKARAKEQGGE